MASPKKNDLGDKKEDKVAHHYFLVVSENYANNIAHRCVGKKFGKHTERNCNKHHKSVAGHPEVESFEVLLERE